MAKKPLQASQKPETASPYPASVLYSKGPQRSFTGANLDQLAFPLGGIGAGQINLGGSGNLIDFSIFNRPNLGSQPMAFATITVRDAGRTAVPLARVIEGPVTHSRIYRGGEFANGSHVGHEGFPHMASAVFRGEFPFARIDFAEPDLPVKVALEGWSPFIPLDDHNSSIPSGILTYSVTNRSRQAVEAVVAFHLQHMIFAKPSLPAGCVVEAKKSATAGGLLYRNEQLAANDPRNATFALATPDHNAIAKAGWFRGAWFDARTMLWREIASGIFEPSRRSKPPAIGGPRESVGGSLAVPVRLKPGQTRAVTFVLAWQAPLSDITFGWPKRPDAPPADLVHAAPAGNSCGCDGKVDERMWRPYHAAKWRGAWAVAQYVIKNLPSLERRSRRFHDAFFATTAPAYVLDAVSANLGILKSPTCLRLADGTLWAFEGCRCKDGCCAGSCTHVWNYAQATAHLFPAVERTLRALELEVSMNEQGVVRFRAPLPPRPPVSDFPAAADGQLGGIMKVYRDWQISGDDAWLRRMYPLAKRSLEYCIGEWDPDRRGALFESHHNTYDIEFFGPDGMCSSIYLGALRAMALMADRIGDAGSAAAWRALADKGLAYVNRELFNGEYYFQKIMARGLRLDFDKTKKYETYSPEAKAIARREGPKYQYGDGCLSDGVIGQWFAEAYGLPDALDRAYTRASLASIFRYNFKPNLRRHANPQRATYALNDEAGLLLCTWPRGGKPALPFVYSDEVWTGIEYQVASHLIYQGMVDEGLTIAKAVRDRYDGFRRNPWNEYECGSYYARAMSSYAVLTALTGFRYSAVDKEVTINPRLKDGKIVSFFSTAKGWGRFTITRRKNHNLSITFDIEEGRLPIRAIRFAVPPPEAKLFNAAAASGPGAGAAAKRGAIVHYDLPLQREGGFATARFVANAVAAPGAPVTITLV